MFTMFIIKVEDGREAPKKPSIEIFDKTNKNQFWSFGYEYIFIIFAIKKKSIFPSGFFKKVS